MSASQPASFALYAPSSNGDDKTFKLAFGKMTVKKHVQDKSATGQIGCETPDKALWRVAQDMNKQGKFNALGSGGEDDAV